MLVETLNPAQSISFLCLIMVLDGVHGHGRASPIG